MTDYNAEAEARALCPHCGIRPRHACGHKTHIAAADALTRAYEAGEAANVDACDACACLLAEETGSVSRLCGGCLDGERAEKAEAERREARDGMRMALDACEVAQAERDRLAAENASMWTGFHHWSAGEVEEEDRIETRTRQMLAAHALAEADHELNGQPQHCATSAEFCEVSQRMLKLNSARGNYRTARKEAADEQGEL